MIKRLRKGVLILGYLPREAVEGLLTSLHSVRERLKREGYQFIDGEIIPPADVADDAHDHRC